MQQANETSTADSLGAARSPAGQREQSPYAAAIRRNFWLIGGAVTAFYCVMVLQAAIGPSTFIAVTGIRELSGLPPAILLFSASLFAYPAGKAMDRYGRIPVIAWGFVLGAVGMALVAVGTRLLSVAPAVLGFVLVGGASAVVALARLAGADMVPAERRGRGVALVMVGAIVGAILGPLVYMSMFAGRGMAPGDLVDPWGFGALFFLIGFVLVFLMGPDPKRIAAALAANAARGSAQEPAAPRAEPKLSQLLGDRRITASLAIAIASHGTMVALMSFIGLMMLDHGHEGSSIFLVVGAHLIGMFGLVFVAGSLTDRLGRRRGALIGAGLLACSIALLPYVDSVPGFLANMFLLGLGWNFAFVATTTSLSSLVPVQQRGRVLGFTDFAANACGAVLSLAGGAVLAWGGAAALALPLGLLIGVAVLPALYSGSWE